MAQSPPREEPGLALTVETLDGKASDTRPARMVALHVAQGAPPTPFVAPGRFRATWTGDLNLRLRERMAFVAEGRGKVTITVKDKVVFEAEGDDLSAKPGAVVRLDKGKNAIVVTYQSPPAGDAVLRVGWKEQNALRAEPVPPTALTHDAAATAVAEGLRLREGRQLLADLRCVKCHAIGGGGMPDLEMPGPSLADAGTRLRRDWMAAWIDDPRAFRKDAHMPRLFHAGAEPAGGIDGRAWDVAAYLASLGPAPADGGEPAPDAVNRGGQLFSILMCSACHTAPGAAAAADGDTRVPLGHVRAKFHPGALRQYLLKPEAHYEWNPMPNFKLSEEEASALAAYLLGNATRAAQPPGAGVTPDPARGRELVKTSGCLNCHRVAEDTNEHRSVPIDDFGAGSWAGGCLAAEPAARGRAPEFRLGEAQRHALLALAATDRSSLRRETPAEFSQRQVAAMRCAACHARDAKESGYVTDFAADAGALAAAFPPPEPAPGAEARGEIFAPDQRPPPLTWTGEKLRAEWVAGFISGRIAYKPRPYLHARMPAWPARGDLLGAGLAAEHGFAAASEKLPAPDETLAPVGQKLIGAAGGFSCVQCHAVGAAPPLAPFEAPALNLRHVTERVRKDYYHRWMLNPIKVDPGTKMPAFADAEGKSAIRDVFEGDAVKQFEAIWQFLLRGDEVKPPG